MAKKKSKYYVRPDGLHEAIRTINGKRVAFRGRSDAEVERKMIEYRAELAKGRKFKIVAEEWEQEHFPTLAPNTLRAYRPALARAIDWFGEKGIQQISAPDVKEFVYDFASKGRAKKTVTTQLQICSMIFAWAVVAGDIEINPCDNVSIPKGLKKTHRDAATPEDEEIIKATPDVWLLPYFILYTGVRKGEALAIQGADLDFKHLLIHVSKSVYHVDGKPYIKPPKTEEGARSLPMLLPLVPHLPKRLKPSQYLFSMDGGKTPLSEGQFRKLWKHYVQSTGVQCTPHQIRHSYATMILDAGLERKDRQGLLGHATDAMTDDVYTHLRAARLQKAAQQLNEKLAGD